MYVGEGVYSLLSNAAFVSFNSASRKQTSAVFLRRNKAIVCFMEKTHICGGLWSCMFHSGLEVVNRSGSVSPLKPDHWLVS